MESLDNPTAYRVGLALLGVGSTFVLSSFFALGFTGTFLGKTLGPGVPGGSRGQVADCPTIWDIFMGSPGGTSPVALPLTRELRAPSLLQVSACPWLAWEAGLSCLIQLVGCQARWDCHLLHLGHQPGLLRAGGYYPCSMLPTAYGSGAFGLQAQWWSGWRSS